MLKSMWSDRFSEKTKLFQVFNYIRECGEGVFQKEILKEIPDMKEGTICMCLRVVQVHRQHRLEGKEFKT